MKKFCLFIFLLLSGSAYAQYYPSTYLRVMNGSDTLLNAFAGGFANPTFFNIDLNNDGLQDIFVFDRGADKVVTFLARKKNDSRYIYHPEYEASFPPGMVNWVSLVDYDGDDKPDIFMHAGSYGNTTGLRVYRNTSSGSAISFDLAKAIVEKENINGFSQMDLGLVEIPVFADMDNDGDIDVLTFDPNFSTRLVYYKNVSQELYNKSDSLVFELRDQCWGKIDELSSEHDYALGKGCSNYLVKKKSEGHAGSAIQLIDTDNDGDKDIIISDIESSEVVILENGRITSSGTKGIDTLINKNKGWPSATNINLNHMPYLSQIDVDNDGILDLVASPAEVDNSQADNIVWYYRNKGNHFPAAAPDYDLVTKDFLEGSMLDGGYYSIPSFWDIDNDGDQDLLLSVEADVSRLMLFTYHTASGKYPYLELTNDDYLGLKAKNYNGLAPVAADMDGDGLMDLVIGADDGKLMYYKNKGTSGSPSFDANPVMLQYDNNGTDTEIKLTGYSKPATADLNGDGKMDMLVGSSKGNLAYFQFKEMKNGNPLYTLETDTFGGTFKTSQGYLIKHTAPALADLDKDGDMDLALGFASGSVRIFKDVSSATQKLVAEDGMYYNYGKGGVENDIYPGYNSVPAIAELDQDTLPDLVIGNYRGGLMMYGSEDNGTGSPGLSSIYRPQPQQGMELIVFPNPAANHLNVKYSGNLNAAPGIIQITDVTGRELIQQAVKFQNGEGQVQIDVSGLPAGMYFLNISQGNRLAAHSRFMITTK